VAKDAISVIPDEQMAIEAALHMGESGDLLLIFADALVRSWKQITKFKPTGAAVKVGGVPPATRPRPSEAKFDPRIEAAAANPEFNLDALIRDERGVRLAPESDD
jgi:cyanophycin synthetase